MYHYYYTYMGLHNETAERTFNSIVSLSKKAFKIWLRKPLTILQKSNVQGVGAEKTHISTDVVELGDEGVLDNIHCHLRCQNHHDIGEQHPQVVWKCNNTVWMWTLSSTQQRSAVFGGLPGFQENCSMFLRQTMSRRMQLVNLSLISVEGRGAKKAIDRG